MRWNITDVSDELHREVKQAAVREGLTLREFVMQSAGEKAKGKTDVKASPKIYVRAPVKPTTEAKRRPSDLPELEQPDPREYIREVSAGVTACPHRFGSICPDCQKEGF